MTRDIEKAVKASRIGHKETIELFKSIREKFGLKHQRLLAGEGLEEKVAQDEAISDGAEEAEDEE